MTPKQQEQFDDGALLASIRFIHQDYHRGILSLAEAVRQCKEAVKRSYEIRQQRDVG